MVIAAKLRTLFAAPKFKVHDIVEVAGYRDVPFMVTKVKPGRVYEVWGLGSTSFSVKEEMLSEARVPAGVVAGVNLWGTGTN